MWMTFNMRSCPHIGKAKTTHKYGIAFSSKLMAHANSGGGGGNVDDSDDHYDENGFYNVVDTSTNHKQ